MADLPALSTEEFSRLCEFIYRRTGMVFTETKRYYVERRVIERMVATRAASFARYYAELRADSAGEIEPLINALTVNETYFYREDHQLKCLTSNLLEERLRGHRGNSGIRIWCAPCSTGEEPFSVAIWLLENWPMVDRYDIEIIGSDIDTQALESCRRATYGRRALMRLPPEVVRRYFEELPDEQWRILDELRDSVQFTPVNLIDPVQTRQHGRFDVIFCRNVLIYFDDSARRLAAENLYENLLPGGFICLGHTESMSRISPLFTTRRFPDAIVYQRPDQEAGHD